MKAFCFLYLAATCLLSGVFAFPALKDPASPQYAEFLKRAAEIKAGKHAFGDILKRAENASSSLETPGGGFGHRRLTALLNPDNFKYNAKEQYVDLTSDEHKYIPPGPADLRGPCPGLNIVRMCNLCQVVTGCSQPFLCSLPTTVTSTVMV